MPPETRSITLGFRISPSLKEALDRAAADDGRSVGSFIERVCLAHLREAGYLPPAPPRKRIVKK